MAGPKIIFVINSLQQGGAERVVSTLSNSLSKRDYQVTIVCMNQAIRGYPIADNIVLKTLVHRQGKQNWYRRIAYGFLTYCRLFRIVLDTKPSCVISFMTSANIWTGLTCLLLRVPYIVSERNTPELTIQQLNPIQKWVSYHIYKNSKAVVLPARGILSALKNVLLFKQLNNYHIIRNPVYEFLPAPKKVVHHRKFILGVGRLSYQKGFDQLITAFSGLKINNVDLLIIGVGMERDQLQQQIIDLGMVDRVFLLGAKNDIEHYYRAASLFVLSSRNEGYPNALVEAMSNGCACVSMDCEFGPREIIVHGENGVLVPAGDVSQLRKEIFRVLSDTKYKAALSAKAGLIGQTNALGLISDKWEALILNS